MCRPSLVSNSFNVLSSSLTMLHPGVGRIDLSREKYASDVIYVHLWLGNHDNISEL